MPVFRLNDPADTVEPGKTGLGTIDPDMKGDAKPTATEEEKSDEQKAADKGMVKEIVLKGPLSHAFTEVLNIMLDRKTNPEGVLRKENVAMAMAAIEATEEDPDVADAHKAYVYVYNGATMGLGDVVNMVEAAQAHKEEHPESELAILVQNADQVVSGKDTAKVMDMAVEQFRQEGITLFFRQEKAVSWVKSRLQKE